MIVGIFVLIVMTAFNSWLVWWGVSRLYSNEDMKPVSYFAIGFGFFWLGLIAASVLDSYFGTVMEYHRHFKRY